MRTVVLKVAFLMVVNGVEGGVPRGAPRVESDSFLPEPKLFPYDLKSSTHRPHPRTDKRSLRYSEGTPVCLYVGVRDAPSTRSLRLSHVAAEGW